MTYKDEKDRLQQSQETDPWKKYAGTDYHQSAIDAAVSGDWDSVTNWLNLRDEKITAQGGDNRGKTSLQIYNDLLAQYGTKTPAATTPTFDESEYEDTRPTFDGSANSKRIDDMLNEILNRDAFSYNAESDPLYQQYKAQYQREGDRAMKDTLAEAAASAGGMNSYAMTAANQANNYYAAQLGDKIPELYQLAYDMYLQDIDNKVRDLGLLQDMDNTQYNRYRDTMSDWRGDREFAYGQYRDDVGDYQWKQKFDYDAGRDYIGDYWTSKEFNYGVEQDTLANQQSERNTYYNRVIDQISMGVMPDTKTLQAADVSEEEAKAMYEKVLAGESLEKDKWNHQVAQDNASSRGKALDQVMDMIANGFTPDEDLVKAAGLDPAEVAEMLKEPPAPGDGEDGLLAPVVSYNVDALKSPEAAKVVDMLYGAPFYGVDIDESGNVTWAKGWNENNWKAKQVEALTLHGIKNVENFMK